MKPSGNINYKSTRRREEEDLIDFSAAYHPLTNDRYQRFGVNSHFRDYSPATPEYERQLFQGKF